jgi:hypothetical protein
MFGAIKASNSGRKPALTDILTPGFRLEPFGKRRKEFGEAKGRMAGVSESKLEPEDGDDSHPPFILSPLSLHPLCTQIVSYCSLLQPNNIRAKNTPIPLP